MTLNKEFRCSLDKSASDIITSRIESTKGNFDSVSTDITDSDAYQRNGVDVTTREIIDTASGSGDLVLNVPNAFDYSEIVLMVDGVQVPPSTTATISFDSAGTYAGYYLDNTTSQVQNGSLELITTNSNGNFEWTGQVTLSANTSRNRFAVNPRWGVTSNVTLDRISNILNFGGADIGIDNEVIISGNENADAKITAEGRR